MRRALATLPLLAVLLALTACGGGGGDDTPTDVGAPGTLRALALEGDPAPDAGAGTFGAFPVYPVMDAAAGGWCAFVAPVVGGSATSVVYVALPDGTATLVRTFAQGDAVSGTARFIAGFDGVWMLADGTLIVLATLENGTGTEDFALLAVDVAPAGTLSNLRTLLVDEDDISATIPGGVLGGIDAMTLQHDADGRLWMLVDDASGGGTHLVSIENDGTGLTKRVSPGDVLTGSSVATIDAFGIDAGGAFYGFAVTDAGGARRLILRETVAMPSINAQVQQDGDALVTVGTVADAWKGGRILVYGNATIAWVCKGTLSGADDVYMLYQHNAAPGSRYVEMARVGETAPDTGMGTFSSIHMLNAAPSAQRVLFNATVNGGTFGVTNATFRVEGISPVSVRGDTADIVLSQGAVTAAPYINLRQTNQPYDEVAFTGDFVYAQTWATTSAIWWVVRSGATQTIFAVAAQGGPAPEGDTFGSFVGGVGMTVAAGTVLFRGPVTTSGTGIFRQGP